MGKISNELKTGIVVLLVILVLVGLLMKTGDLGVKPKGYTVTARFQSAAGIKKFAPVRLAGVEVGEVRDVKLVYDEAATGVEAVLWVESKIKLRKDSTALMSSLGLMGEKYVEIRSGTSAEFVEPGGAIATKDPVNFDELMEKASVAMDEATVTMQEFKTLAKHANEILVDAKPKVSGILTNLDGILAKNRSKLDSIMANLEVTSEYFKEFSEDVKHHPWKVLMKGKDHTPEEMVRLRVERDIQKVKLAALEEKTREELVGADSKKSGSLFFPANKK